MPKTSSLQRALNIHLENIAPEMFPNRDNTYFFRQIMERDIPVGVSVAPWQSLIWTPQVLGLARAIVKRPGSFLGQQGELHMCPHKHSYLDINHENFCLWGSRLGKARQREFMLRGMDFLERLFGVVPKVYVPPNHLSDSDTIEVAAGLGFTHLTDAAALPINPYERKGIIITPEGSIEKGLVDGRRVVCVHYDRIHSSQAVYGSILSQGIIPLDEVPISTLPQHILITNEALKRGRKYIRDLAHLLKGRRSDSEKERAYRQSYVEKH